MANGYEEREANGLLIIRYRIIDTSTWMYGAWEPSPPTRGGMYAHSTVTRDTAERVLGRVGTDRLPVELDLLPSGEDRWARVTAWRRAQDERAYAAIIAAYPEAADGFRESGVITTGEL